MTKTNKQSLSDIIEIDGVKYQRVEEPEPQMNLVDDGTFTKVSYNGMVYYRTESKLSAFWWLVQKNRDVARPNVLVMVIDTETEQLLEGVYRNNIVVKKKQEPEPEPKTKTLSLKQLLMKWEFEFSTKWENPKNRNSELYMKNQRGLLKYLQNGCLLLAIVLVSGGRIGIVDIIIIVEI